MNKRSVYIIIFIFVLVIVFNIVTQNFFSNENFVDIENINSDFDIEDTQISIESTGTVVYQQIEETTIETIKEIVNYPTYDNVGRRYLSPGEQFTWSNRCQSVRYESVYMKTDKYVGNDGEGEPNEAPPYEEVDKLPSSGTYKITNPITGDVWGYRKGGFGLTGNKVEAEWINHSISKRLMDESIAKRDESRRIYEESTGNWTEEEKRIHESEMYELSVNWAAATHGMTPEEYLEWYETIPYDEYWVRDPRDNYGTVTKIKNLTPEELKSAIEYMQQIGEEPYK